MDDKLQKKAASLFIPFLLLGLFSKANGQEANSLLNRCWPSSNLAEKIGEKKFIYHNHTFDAPPSSKDNFLSAQIIPQNYRGPIRRVHLHSEKKLLALTFDLCELSGEIAGYDAALIQFLREQQIKATLFAGGKWMRSHSERTHQLMVDPLFEIANHSETHRNLRLLKNKALTDQILDPEYTYDALRSALKFNQCIRENDPMLEQVSEKMSLFRFPFGACNEESIKAVNNAGYFIIQWDVSTGDPSKKQSAKAIAETILKAKPGSIIIGHANGHGYNTAEGLKIALPELRKRGFDFVTVSELLKEGVPEISQSCYDRRIGDTDKYDTFFSNREKKSLN
ncbi:MAG: polysaccharide deacetylase family protein [Hyphomicrobium sp.]